MINKISKPITDCNNNKYVNPDYYSVVVVRTLQERNNIPCKLRQDGMIVTVIEEGYYHRYQIQSIETGKGICNNASFVRVVDAGPGLSAYEVWLSLGNVGSEIDFLNDVTYLNSMKLSIIDGELIVEDYVGDTAKLIDGELVLNKEF